MAVCKYTCVCTYIIIVWPSKSTLGDIPLQEANVGTCRDSLIPMLIVLCLRIGSDPRVDRLKARGVTYYTLCLYTIHIVEYYL